MANSDKQRRLITIPMSHYCEKARWGLERLGLPYYEERHLQLFHYPRTFWVSRGPNVPVLVDNGRVIKDSTLILKYLDRYADAASRLYPQDPGLCTQVDLWEDRFDKQLGPDSRRWVYYHMFPRPAAEGIVVAGQGAPDIEKKLAPYGYRFMKWFIGNALTVTPTEVEAGLQRSREILVETDRLLADGRPYLLGERFTAADLALACMLSPFVMPRNYGIRLPTLDEAPESMHADIKLFRATRTGEYVLRLFEHERIDTVNRKPAAHTRLRNSPLFDPLRNLQ